MLYVSPDPTYVIILFMVLMFGLICVIGLLIAAVVWWMRRAQERQARPGFEVKQPTGGTPVLREEKDQNHG
jgi:hypothetical protein